MCPVVRSWVGLTLNDSSADCAQYDAELAAYL